MGFILPINVTIYRQYIYILKLINYVPFPPACLSGGPAAAAQHSPQSVLTRLLTPRGSAVAEAAVCGPSASALLAIYRILKARAKREVDRPAQNKWKWCFLSVLLLFIRHIKCFFHQSFIMLHRIAVSSGLYFWVILAFGLTIPSH